jgi:hypothetical protein
MVADSTPLRASWTANLHASCIKYIHRKPATTLATHQTTTNTDIGAQTKAFSDIIKILTTMRAESDKAKLREIDDDGDKKEEPS